MEHTVTKICPHLIYTSYPGSDLLAIDPPSIDETFQEYRRRVSDDALCNSGDTLFAFILLELSNANNKEEALRLLSTAMNDLLTIHAAIAALPED